MSDTNVFLLLALGFTFGLRHALDSDHVAVVMTFISEKRSLRKYCLIGLSWGLGHTITLLLVGASVVMLQWTIPNQLASVFEISAGVLLVYFGKRVILRTIRSMSHTHFHEHNGYSHSHLHMHKDGEGHGYEYRSFLVGVVHALAGSAPIMILVLPTISHVPVALLYLLAFGIGSVIGMAVTSTFAGIFIAYAASRSSACSVTIAAASGFVSIAVGTILLWKYAIL